MRGRPAARASAAEDAALSHTSLEQARHDVESEYRLRTPRSRRLFDEARGVVAGGVTRATSFWRPYPTVVDRGHGCRLTDVDGNELLDFNGNFTAALWGNDPPFLVAAIREAAPRLIGAGAATPEIQEWARLLRDLYPTVDLVRFCCSGTEAVMFACRAARAATGRPKILKHRGSYHGTTDPMEADMPTSQRGISPHAGDDVIAADFWDFEGCARILREHAHELAAVLVNPIWFAAGDGILAELAALARRHDVLVVSDEVMSFRYGPGGGQALFGFEADVSVFGKSIGGGGLAVGAFGGRERILRLFSPLDNPSPVHHSGTFVANPITVAAGIAALRRATPELFAGLNHLGERLRDGFRRAFERHGVRAELRGAGSLVLMGLGKLGLRFGVTDPGDAAEVKRLFGLALLNRGLFTPADAFIWAISEPMTEIEIDQAIAIVEETLATFRPVIEGAVPELLLPVA
jgi:glutamate-1-semialdehyde 2,1-aminomutase